MTDINIRVIAEKLGKDIENLVPRIEEELKGAVANLAQATYASMISQVQSMSMDPMNRQDYLRALQIQELGEGSWMIFLDSKMASRLEEGFPPYSIKDKLLASTKKVAIGSRAGQPWVRTSKKGKKYAAVPFSHKPFSGEKGSAKLGSKIQELFAKNMQGKRQKITKVFKDEFGKPLVGKVATVGKVKGEPNLSGLTKYQWVSPKGKVSSVYMTYRMVHEDSGGWQHPGFKGYRLFKQAEEYVKKELENIVQTLL